MRTERRGVRSPTAWILVVSFTVSITFLIIYIAELNFNDNTLYIFLTVIRYSSFMVFICSLYKIFTNSLNIFRLVFGSRERRRKSDRDERKMVITQSVLRILLYLVLIAYGFGIFYLEAFIIVFSGGFT